jgi:hypothetical protein
MTAADGQKNLDLNMLPNVCPNELISFTEAVTGKKFTADERAAVITAANAGGFGGLAVGIGIVLPAASAAAAAGSTGFVMLSTAGAATAAGGTIAGLSAGAAVAVVALPVVAVAATAGVVTYAIIDGIKRTNIANTFDAYQKCMCNKYNIPIIQGGGAHVCDYPEINMTNFEGWVRDQKPKSTAISGGGWTIRSTTPGNSSCSPFQDTNYERVLNGSKQYSRSRPQPEEACRMVREFRNCLCGETEKSNECPSGF